ncbi:MAG: hypothetical protein HOO08_03955 [Opitutae bacterium]|nr:hypothetical protein [Opitutae bacterium]
MTTRANHSTAWDAVPKLSALISFWFAIAQGFGAKRVRLGGLLNYYHHEEKEVEAAA